MTNSRKCLFVSTVILACNCILSAAIEPNQPQPELTVEVSEKLMPWSLGHVSRHARGLIEPTHMAEVFVLHRYWPSLKAESFLKTAAAAAMTPKQREFVKGSDAFANAGDGGKIRNHDEFLLYAVSEADARRMIDALIEILGERPKRRRLEYATKLQEYREEMAKAKGLLPGKEALLPSVKADYHKSKELSHAFSADTEAADHAKKTILEMSKMLDTLDVELAGIREKLKVIQDYWSQDGMWTKEAFAKLQELQIIQTIELKGAEARRKAAVAIRRREKDFLDLFHQWTSLESTVKSLRSRIESRQRRIAEIEAILANPKADMLGPKIYQDKVVIYPVGGRVN